MFLVVVGTALPIWTYDGFVFAEVCLKVVGMMGFLQGLPLRAAEALSDNILQADVERQHPWHLSDDETDASLLGLLYNWHVSLLFYTLFQILHLYAKPIAFVSKASMLLLKMFCNIISSLEESVPTHFAQELCVLLV